MPLLDRLAEFFCNTIGIVYDTDYEYGTLHVMYDDVPYKLRRFFKFTENVFVKKIMVSSIVCFDKSKDLLVIKNQTNKFNI